MLEFKNKKIPPFDKNKRYNNKEIDYSEPEEEKHDEIIRNVSDSGKNLRKKRKTQMS